MARSARKDPLDKFRFTVSIDNFTKAGFTSISAPGVDINTKKYKEGGRHLNPVLIVDSTAFKPVTLTRGVTVNSDFYSWAKQPFELVYGKKKSGNIVIPVEIGGISSSTGTAFGIASSLTESGKVYRRDVTISQLDRRGRVIKQYILKNAIPISFSPASEFNAVADDTFSIESLTIEYEGFIVRTLNKDGNLDAIDPREILKRAAKRIPF